MENQKKISFFKKIWWSITNVNKYDEMINLGLRNAIKYLLALLVILSIILACVSVYIQSKNTGEIINYLNEKVPEFSLEKKDENYKLSIDTKETVILEDSQFVNFFKSVVVMNDSLEEKEATKEYSSLANNDHNCVVFLKDECMIITQNESEVTKYKYGELLTKITGKNEDQYDKMSLIDYFNNMPYVYYMCVYFLNYFIIILMVFALDVIIIGALSLLYTKIVKLQTNIKKLFVLAIYALTLSTILYIIYLIINFFTKYYFAYINIINMLIAYIYVIVYFMKKRKKVLQEDK